MIKGFENSLPFSELARYFLMMITNLNEPDQYGKFCS